MVSQLPFAERPERDPSVLDGRNVPVISLGAEHVCRRVDEPRDVQCGQISKNVRKEERAPPRLVPEPNGKRHWQVHCEDEVNEPVVAKLW